MAYVPADTAGGDGGVICTTMRDVFLVELNEQDELLQAGLDETVFIHTVASQLTNGLGQSALRPQPKLRDKVNFYIRRLAQLTKVITNLLTIKQLLEMI